MFQEEGPDSASLDSSSYRHWLCDLYTVSYLTSNRHPDWVLRASTGAQVMRVRVGRGTVTVINGVPFRYRSLLDGDHAWLLVAASQFRRGDDVRFLSEEDHGSLLALAWHRGAPVLLLALVAVFLGLWRGAVRFGPPVATPDFARRSLAEQIHGTGLFAMRFDSDQALHGAAVRALDEAARRRIPGYPQLSPRDRSAALAHVTGLDGAALSAAIYHPARREPGEVRQTLALIETARRRTLTDRRGASHGTR